jgi:hypothetical protein
LLVCIVVVSAGCGEWKRPEWMGGKPESPVIAPTEITPTSQPASGPAPLVSPPADSTSPEVAPISQENPDLMEIKRAQKQKQLVDLSSPKRPSGDSASPATAPPEKLSKKIEPEPLPAERTPPEKTKPTPTEPEPIFDEPEETTPPAEPAVKPHQDLQKKPPAPEPQQPERIVLNKEEVVAGATLQINDTHLTVEELLSGLHRELSKIPAHVKGEAFRNRVGKILSAELMYQVQQTLVFAEADRLLEEGPKMQIDVEMEEALRKMIAEAGGSREKLRQKCIQEGTTLEDMLRAHRRSLTVQMYMRSKFYPAIVINRRMLWDYYRRHKDEFTTEQRVQMQIIAVPYGEFLRQTDDSYRRQPTQAELDAAKALAMQRVEEALTDLKAGADFTETVKQFSMGLKRTQGGNWPMMGRGNFREKKVENAAFALKAGQYSGIIEGQGGYYIVKAKAVEPGKVVNFEDAQAAIAEKLRRKQFMNLRSEYLRKIYQKATIGDPEVFINLAVERAIEKYRR